MQRLSWLEIGLLVVVTLVVGGLAAYRYLPGLQPSASRARTVRAMKLEIGTANFVLMISNAEPVFYKNCRATLDGKYQFGTSFDLAAPRWFDLDLHRIRINLADFSRGGERYDWQKRIPTRVEVECSEYLVPPPDALGEYGLVDWRKFSPYEAQWTKSSARFTGGFK